MVGGERTGVFLCHCGTNISDIVDLGKIEKFSRGLRDVVDVLDSRFLCAESGQKIIQKRIKEKNLSRIVVAACSPLMHESTFQGTMEDAGLNPFCLQMANIREQVSWVTPDRLQATEKAMALVAAAIHRVGFQVPLHVRKVPVVPAALVIGAGIAGIESALQLADTGTKVTLVEREPSIGGHMAKLSRTFPTLDCSACILVPKMARAAEHPNITLLTNGAIVEVGGGIGKFLVKVHQRARYVREDLCTGCGLCVERCPRGGIPSEADEGLGVRSAIYYPFPQAVPWVPVIDRTNCDHFQTGDCDECSRICPIDAVDFEQQDKLHEIEAGAVILATGFRLFDPQPLLEYGYGRWKNVMTSLQFERLCHPSGQTKGKIVTKDGHRPESIAILHCIGSRDRRFNRHCSRVCCMSSLKLALLARKQTGARVFNLYTDLRVAGKNCEEFLEQVQRAGVTLIQGRGTEVVCGQGKLHVTFEDTIMGRNSVLPVDIVVLAVGMEPRKDAATMARHFGISCTEGGFFMERHLKASPVQTAVPGVFIAGACQGPKDIPDSVVQGAAAAAGALHLIGKGTVDTVPTVAEVDPEHCSGCLLCIRDCPYYAIEPVSVGGRTVAKVSEVHCKSCGSCAATCPAGAIEQHGFTSRQLFAEVEGILGR
jgi:heterodisulfide reductase subunit A